jgi:hypothetical protein
VLRAQADAEGEPLTVTKRGLATAFKDAGLLPTELDYQGRVRRGVREYVEGVRRRVWKLPISWLRPDDDDEDGQPTPDTPTPPPAPPAPPLPTGPADSDQPVAADDTAPAESPADATNEPRPGNHPGQDPNGPESGTEPPRGGTRREPAPPPAPAAAQSPPTVRDSGAPPATTRQPARPAPQTGASSRPHRRRAGKYRAAVVVCDATTGHLSTGEDLPLPDELSLPDLIEWAAALNLGTQPRAGADAPGQVWLRPELVPRLGLPPTLPASTGRGRGQGTKAGQALTRQVAALNAVGWKVGRRGLVAWTTLYQPGGRTIRLVVPGWWDQNGLEALAGLWDPDELPGDQAATLGRYAELVGAPVWVSPAITGCDRAFALRARTVPIHRPVPLPPESALPLSDVRELDYLWQRPPTADELRSCPYVHVWDKRAQYLAGANDAWLGLGEPKHLAAPEFDPKVPGYWLLRWSAPPHRLLPDILDPTSRASRDEVWVATPTLEYLTEIDEAPPIRQAWVWPQRSRWLEPWYKELRDARAAVMASTNPLDTAVEAAIKRTYAATIGWFAHKPKGDRAPGEQYLPYLRHAVISRSRATLTRQLHRTGQWTGRYPLAVYRDSVAYAATSADPADAFPAVPADQGGGLRLGTNPGAVQWAGMARMSEVADILAQGPRAGADLIGAFSERLS